MKLLADFPNETELISMYPVLDVLNVNAHIHTPYSFSSFDNIHGIFCMAVKEGIACLGINDFFVADGYESFHNEAMSNAILPLFNIEFIALMRDEQQRGIRINDPNNPGRCYFSGKGLDYPFHMSNSYSNKLDNIIGLSQHQIKAMIGKLNGLFAEIGSDIELNYDVIRKDLAKNLVRERHLAKAVRLAVFERYTDNNSRNAFLKILFGGKTVESPSDDIPSLENEIRGNLLKSGGLAFVEEDENTFMSIDEIMEIINDAGGIPCYPVLLDDKKGNYTEFESSPERLWNELSSRNINCIELIPGRNDATHLDRFVDYFSEKGFIILLGTEHNTPDMIPLTCDSRGKQPLSSEMKRTSYEGACVIAAHQYLRARGKTGFVHTGNTSGKNQIRYFKMLGNAVIHYQHQNNAILL
jgi:hypothetical protein